MSLRPRDFAVTRVRRAGQRMAPGGRRWSESPVPRPGVRRPRQVGPTAVVAPAVVTGIVNYPEAGNFSLGVSDVGSRTVDVFNHSSGIPLLSEAQMSTWPAEHGGQEIVVFAFGVNTGWSAPSSWKVIGSGSLDELDWIVARTGLYTGQSGVFTLSDMSDGWTEQPGDKGTWTFHWWRVKASHGGIWRCEADGYSGGGSRSWWQPSSAWWTEADADYLCWNAAAMIPITTSDDIAYEQDDPSIYAGIDSWVYGNTRRLWGFYGRYWEHGTSYTLSESTASTSGSRWLQVGIGWTP